MATFCFDLDGTLCTNTYGRYEEAQPYRWAVERVNALAGAGHRVIIFTARGSSTGVDWSETTRAQLDAWGVRFDELAFGKPTADVFVDDRAFPAETWRWGHTTVLAGPACTDPSRREAMAYGIAGLAPPLDAAAVEIGRTFRGRALWLDDHVDALLATADVPHSRDELRESVRRVVEPPEGVLGAAGETVFTLLVAGDPHPAYIDVYEPDAYPAVTVSCRPWSHAAQGLRRLRPTAAWSGVRAFALGDGTIRGTLDGDVTAARVVEAARAAGFEAADGDAAPGPGEEAVLVSPPFPLLPEGAAGKHARAIARALADATGVDPLAELNRLG